MGALAGLVRLHSDPGPDLGTGPDAGSDESHSPVVVGKISGQYGVKGWVKVYSYTRPAAQILEYARWMLAAQPDSGDWQSVTVASVRRQSKKLLAKLAGIDDRSGADELLGQWIAVRPSQFPRLPRGEYYWSDLTGLGVVNQDGVELGVVAHLVETGANDVLVVRDDPANVAADTTAAADGIAAASERLLPWLPEVIVEVDLEGGRIRVEWNPDD